MLKPTLLTLSALVLLSGCNSDQKSENTASTPAQDTPSNEPAGDISIWPTLDIKVKKDQAVEDRVSSIMADMTIEQKVAQMIQPEIRDITPEDMRKYGFGSYLNGGGSFPDGNKHSTPEDWIRLAEDMYQASIDDSLDGSTIPTMWGTDAVHGHNNVIGATLFPHNIGLGAAHNPELIEQIARATATEVMATGIDWVFAPTVATVRDDRWGRTYEGYSEDPEIVKEYAAAIVTGLQGEPGEGFLGDDRVISTVKHFVGDGGTVGGDDQGDTVVTEQELFDIHAQGYVGGLTAGAQSVMASFNSWHGKKLHGHKYLLSDVLKDKMGFDGFIVGDWSGHGQIAGCTNEDCPQAINAGLDMYMSPTMAWKPLFDNTVAQVKSGEIPMARVDDAVRRILRVKVRAGLFEKPSPANRELSGRLELIGAEPHREIARQAVRESLVMLKNNDQLLPLAPNQHFLIAGDGADNIGKQAGGWTITWQGTGNNNDDFPGGTSIYDGIKAQVEAAGGSVELSVDGTASKKPDVAIVVFGEDPYAEGHGDRQSLEYQRGEKRDLALLQSLQVQDIPVVSVFLSGRPMWVNAELNASDAFVAAWLPGSEGAAVADVLMRDAAGEVQTPITGKLTFSWPREPYQIVNRNDEEYNPLFAYGYGLSFEDNVTVPSDFNEDAGDESATVGERVMYSARMQRPWLLWLFSGAEQRIEVNAGVMELGAVSYRTIDREVQEDAMQVTLSGAEDAGVAFVSKSNFREDLRADITHGGAIQFMLNVEKAPASPLMLSMRCEGDGQCGASVDISPLLQEAGGKGWQNYQIDLRCFANEGMKFGDTVMPFSLHSAAPVTFSLAEVSIVPNSAETANLVCQ